MGLPIKIGLGFLVALGVSIVIFGNLIAPVPTVNPTHFTTTPPSAENSNSEPELTRYINPATSPDPKENLTSNVASIIGKNIVNLNPQGPLDKKLTVEQARIVAEKALNESLQKIDVSRFAPRIPLDRIIIKDNSHYTADLALILKEHSDALQQKQPTHSPHNDIATVLLVYQNSLTKLTELPTPEKYTVKQQSIISIIQGQINALQALQDYENDPVQGLVALQAFIDAEKKLTALTRPFSL